MIRWTENITASAQSVSQPKKKKELRCSRHMRIQYWYLRWKKGERFVLNQLLPEYDEKRNYTAIVRFWFITLSGHCNWTVRTTYTRNHGRTEKATADEKKKMCTILQLSLEYFDSASERMENRIKRSVWDGESMRKTTGIAMVPTNSDLYRRNIDLSFSKGKHENHNCWFDLYTRWVGLWCDTRNLREKNSCKLQSQLGTKCVCDHWAMSAGFFVTRCLIGTEKCTLRVCSCDYVAEFSLNKMWS